MAHQFVVVGSGGGVLVECARRGRLMPPAPGHTGQGGRAPPQRLRRVIFAEVQPAVLALPHAQGRLEGGELVLADIVVGARERDVLDHRFGQAQGARPPLGALPHGAVVLAQRDGATPLLARWAGEPEAEPRDRGVLAENIRLEHPPLRRRDLVGELEQDVGARLSLAG